MRQVEEGHSGKEKPNEAKHTQLQLEMRQVEGGHFRKEEAQ
jgi:hypothetical protein